MNGVSVERDRSKRTMVFHIDNLSKDLKQVIREHLSTVCRGENAEKFKAKHFSYEGTLKEFLRRYDDKPQMTKKGMIGELLAHILILHYRADLKQVSPFFNLEERSIKKGFDIVLYDIAKEKLWIAEVKSGKAKASAASKTKALLSLAKRDLVNRFGKSSESLWYNAINGAEVALKAGKIKNSIIEKLDIVLDSQSSGESAESEQNAILISVVYQKMSDKVAFGTAAEMREKILKEGIFADLIIFSMQKATFSKVANFLRQETNGS